MSRGRTVGLALAAAVGVVVPALVLGVLLVADLGSVLESEAPPEPIVVPVAKTAFDDRRPVLVRFAWSEGEVARSSGLEGLVISVAAGPGDTLGSGDAVAEVSGVRVVAFISEAPLYRPLARGDKGDDVARLERFLLDMGLLAEDHVPSGEVTRSVSSAIGLLNERLGIERVRRSSTGRVVGPEFDPSATLWVGDEPFVVGTVLVEPGMPWPGIGEPVLQAPGRLDDVVLFTLAETGEPPTEVALPEGFVLVINEVTIPLDASGRVTAEGRTRLPTLVDAETSEMAASVRLAKPVEALKVPPSAVVEGQGATCVYALSGAGPFEPVAVEVVASLFGEAVVEASRPIAEVLANPAQIIMGPRCG